MEVKEMNCPNCGNPVSAEEKKCRYCGGPIVITNFVGAASLTNIQLNKYVASYKRTVAEQPDNTQARVSMGLCRLRLRFYDDSLVDFQKALQDDFCNADLHFYCAVCLLRGKKPFLHNRPVIDEIVTYLEAAISVEPKGVYYCFLSYIIADYFERKKFKTASASRSVFAEARSHGCTDSDIALLFDILSLDKPTYM